MGHFLIRGLQKALPMKKYLTGVFWGLECFNYCYFQKEKHELNVSRMCDTRCIYYSNIPFLLIHPTKYGLYMQNRMPLIANYNILYKRKVLALFCIAKLFLFSFQAKFWFNFRWTVITWIEFLDNMKMDFESQLWSVDRRSFKVVPFLTFLVDTTSKSDLTSSMVWENISHWFLDKNSHDLLKVYFAPGISLWYTSPRLCITD